MNRKPSQNFLYRSLSCVSESDELRAIVREIPANGNGTNKQYLEIWKHHQLFQNYDLSALDVHGEVYTDGLLTLLHRIHI